MQESASHQSIDDSKSRRATGADSRTSDSAVGKNERTAVLLLCCLAAIHVFVFSSAFPFFSAIDEDAHFDMVVKYSHGHLPRGMETVSSESARYIATFGTREYLSTAHQFPGGTFPAPPWTQPASPEKKKLFDYEVRALMGTNLESSQPPLYYALAGLWRNLGKAIGLRGGDLLYWIRFLNVPMIAALVWLGYVAARMVFPENGFARIGVPTLLAFLPQTSFYSIQNDALSALCFGVAFILLLRLLREEPHIRLGLATGLALAATYLTKLSNLPLLAISAVLVILKFRLLWKAGKVRASLPAMALLILSAGIPISLWRAWSTYNFGDAMGSETKIGLLGWTHKAFADWWSHPIFTPKGFFIFFSNLIASFWRGEFLWHSQPLSSSTVDTIYLALSIVFFGVSIVALWRRSSFPIALQQQALWLSLASCFSVVLFLGFLSIVYDFHECFYPSREHPYFTSGRLMMGALIPFSLIFVYGISSGFRRMKIGWMRPLFLVALVLFMLISEIAVNWPVFSSRYNWFAM
jgi:hypothetical protein